MIADVSDRVIVMIQPRRFRVHRRKSPVLAFGKNRIRRRAAGGFLYKQVAIRPDVVTVRMKSERKVQIEDLIVALRFISEGVNLRLDAPLRVLVILLDFWIVIASADASVLQAGRPGSPAGTL